MTDDQYFVITITPDTQSICAYGKGDLLEELETEELSSCATPEDLPSLQRIQGYGHDLMTGFNGKNHLIIKGHIVMPRPVEKVTQYEVD